MGLLAFVRDGELKPINNESAFATQRQIESTQKPLFIEYVTISESLRAVNGAYVAYSVPAGRRLYLQSVFIYDSANGGIIEIRDGSTLKTLTWIGGVPGATYPYSETFASPVVMDTNLTIFTSALYNLYFTFIGYLL